MYIAVNLMSLFYLYLNFTPPSIASNIFCPPPFLPSLYSLHRLWFALSMLSLVKKKK